MANGKFWLNMVEETFSWANIGGGKCTVGHRQGKLALSYLRVNIHSI